MPAKRPKLTVCPTPDLPRFLYRQAKRGDYTARSLVNFDTEEILFFDIFYGKHPLTKGQWLAQQISVPCLLFVSMPVSVPSVEDFGFVDVPEHISCQVLSHQHHTQIVANVVDFLRAKLDAFISSRPRRRIATDASIRSFGGLAGLGWVSDDGDFGTTTCRAKSSNHAEVKAISFALSRLKEKPGPVEIITDSQVAVSLVRSTLQDQSSIGHAPPEVKEDLMKIASIASRNSVQLTWVRSHSGHILNGIADRLAVLARRDKDARVTRHEHFRKAQSVVLEHGLNGQGQNITKTNVAA